MGGTEKDCDDDEGPVMKNKEDVSEAIISKLLNDFNSAALLKGSVGSTPDLDVANENVGCEEIASSLKHLHLRKPANSRQKLKERKAGSRKGRASSGNKYNLSVAAVNVQRPVLWPGKLNNSSKEDLPVLHPPRLSLCKKEENSPVRNSSTTSVVSTSSGERSRIESELKRHRVRQFGSLSESQQQHQSFSYLSEKHTKLNSLSDNAASKKSDKCMPSSSSTVKRPNSCSFPVAKHPRLYQEIHVSSDIAQFLDFRCPSSHEDNINTNSLPSSSRKRGTVQESSSSKKDNLGSCLKASETPSSSSNITSASCESISSSQEGTTDESNVNELASYFDDLLHIPRKMSVMAEMMYA